MKIAFVAGCLEPGRDGVGDYTRSLASECARQGHTVALLSLAEREPHPAAGEGSSNAMETLRLSQPQWLADRGREARAWLDAFGAEWASLQFVPYSFDPRGFFQASIEPLAHILGGARRRHVFFHETWIGSQVGASAKSRLYGWWQRRAVRGLLRELAPACVHTSTGYYCAALATLRQQASLLPVIGAVPHGGNSVVPLEFAGVPPGALVCGHFGTLHPGWSADAFLADFAALGARSGRPAALVAVGSLGYGSGLFAEVAARWKDRVHCADIGRLETAALARAFARFDFAVTSVPWNIIAKSSSAAAMREHGLRVVVTEHGRAPRFPHVAFDPGERDDGFVLHFRDRTLLPSALVKTAPCPGVAAMAKRFLADLDAAR